MTAGVLTSSCFSIAFPARPERAQDMKRATRPRAMVIWEQTIVAWRIFRHEFCRPESLNVGPNLKSESSKHQIGAMSKKNIYIKLLFWPQRFSELKTEQLFRAANRSELN